MAQISDRVNRLAASATFAMLQKSNELSAQGVDVVNMSVGEPDFNTPDYVKKAAIEEASKKTFKTLQTSKTAEAVKKTEQKK